MSQNLKISIGMNLQDGPFGGGNQFGRSLRDYLIEQGNKVIFHLNDSDIDIILLTEPRTTSAISAYTDEDILQYLAKKPDTIVVHRVNECDERKRTRHVNRVLRRANLVADHTVFVSTWLRDLHLRQGMDAIPNTVIHNGSDNAIFHSRGYKAWNGVDPLRLVTHHWGANWNKGFDIYQKIDELLENEQFRQKYVFTYIGNLPTGFTFKNANYIPPHSGQELARLLRGNHIYITASRNEPGSNHQNEGALCGLPLLFLGNASMSEYATGFGISFSPNNFEARLEIMRDSYSDWISVMDKYPFTSQRASKEYFSLFSDLYANRDTLFKHRTRQSHIKWLFKKFEIKVKDNRVSNKLYQKVFH